MMTYFFVLQLVKDFYVMFSGRSCYALAAVLRLSEILRTRPSACLNGSLAGYSMDTWSRRGTNIWDAGTGLRSPKDLHLLKTPGPGLQAPSTPPPRCSCWRPGFVPLRFTLEGARGWPWASPWSHSRSPQRIVEGAGHCYPSAQRDPFWVLISSPKRGSSPKVGAIFHWQGFPKSFLCYHRCRQPWHSSWLN